MIDKFFIQTNETIWDLESSEYWSKWQTFLENRGYYDWAKDPQPSDKRYNWKGEMGHLISDEFKDKKKMGF